MVPVVSLSAAATITAAAAAARRCGRTIRGLLEEVEPLVDGAQPLVERPNANLKALLHGAEPFDYDIIHLLLLFLRS